MGNTWYKSQSLRAVTYNACIFVIAWDFTDSYWYAYMDTFVYRGKDGMTWVLYSNTSIIHFIINAAGSGNSVGIKNGLNNAYRITITIGLDSSGKRMIYANYLVKLLYSYDHSIWFFNNEYNIRNNNTRMLMVAYFNSTWVTSINGGSNSIAYSTDGLNWNYVLNSMSILNIKSGSLSGTGALFVTNGSIILGHYNGQMVYSYDAINWKSVNIGGRALSDLFYSGSCFIGLAGTGSVGEIITSVDGIAWVYTSKYNNINFASDMAGGSLFNSRSAIKTPFLPGPQVTIQGPIGPPAQKLILNDITKSGIGSTLTNNGSIVYVSSAFSSAFVIDGTVIYPNIFSIFLNIKFNVTCPPGNTYRIVYTLAIGQSPSLNFSDGDLTNINTGERLSYGERYVSDVPFANALGYINVTQGTFIRSTNVILRNLIKNSNPWYIYFIAGSYTPNGVVINSPVISCQVINIASAT